MTAQGPTPPPSHLKINKHTNKQTNKQTKQPKNKQKNKPLSSYIPSCGLSPMYFIFYMQLPPSSTTFELEVMLNRYTNAEEREGRNRDHCEGDENGCSLTATLILDCPCDNIFTFCLRPLGTTQDNNNANCPLGRFVTGSFEDNDNIDFTHGTNLMNSLSNPLVYRGNLWPVSPPVIL